MTASLHLSRAAIVRSSGLGFALVGVALGVGAGVIIAHNRSIGLAAVAALCLLMLVIRRPVASAIVALVGSYVAQRVGAGAATPGAQGGVAYSDVLLAGAAFLALPALLGTVELRRLRGAAVGLGIYLACLLPTVLLHHSSRAELEWLHRLVLVGGSLLVGAWIVHERLTRAALRWLVLVSCLVALAAIQNTVRHSFLPASPFGLNKNFIGALLGAVLVVIIAAPSRVALTRTAKTTAIVLTGVGLLASQSRGAFLAAALALLLAYWLGRREHGRAAKGLALVFVGVFGVVAFLSVRSQLQQTKADLNNSSIGVRFNVERETRAIWRTSRVDGVGLKYFNTGNYGYYAQAPNNIVDNELAESGVIGLAGFAILQGCAFVTGVRRRRDNSLAVAGVAVVAGELLHGMVDIYWVSGSVSLPFIILGMGLAAAPEAKTRAAARHRSSRRRPLAAV